MYRLACAEAKRTRETQFKPKERESGDVTEVLRLSYYTLGGPG